MRIGGEATMSAPPFFQLARRGDLLVWGGKEGSTVIIWKSLSEQEKTSWLEEASTTHDFHPPLVMVHIRDGSRLVVRPSVVMIRRVDLPILATSLGF